MSARRSPPHAECCTLQAAVSFLLLAHMPLVLSAALLPLSGYPLPYPPVLIVWLELLIHPLAFLAFQQAADGMRPPLERDARFFNARQWAMLVCIGALYTLAVSLGFVMALIAPEPRRALGAVAVQGMSAR